MTPKDVKRELRKIRNLKKEILIIEQEIEMWRAKAESAGGFKTEFVPINGYASSNIEEYIAKLIEYQGKLGYKRMSLMTAVEQAENLIDLLTDDEGACRAVLRLRYIMGMTQERMADELHYTERRIRQLEWEGVKLIARRST